MYCKLNKVEDNYFDSAWKVKIISSRKTDTLKS